MSPKQKRPGVSGKTSEPQPININSNQQDNITHTDRQDKPVPTSNPEKVKGSAKPKPKSSSGPITDPYIQKTKADGTLRKFPIIEDEKVLYFKDDNVNGRPAIDALDNAKAFDGKKLADPFRPDHDLGNMDDATFNYNNGVPMIHCKDNNGHQYVFRRFQNYVDGEPWFNDAIATSSVSRFIDQPTPELDYVFKDTIMAGNVGMLVGPGGSGKSTLAIIMLIAAATGRDLLPNIFTPTKAGKVLGIFAEDSEAVLHCRIADITSVLLKNDPTALALLKENMKVICATGHDLRLCSKEQQERTNTKFYDSLYEQTRGIDDLRLVVLDPLSRFHGEDENDNGAGTDIIKLLERIANTTNAAVIVLHHVTKNAGYTMRRFNLEAAMHQDAARGASGLTNGVRWQCNLFGLPVSDAKKCLNVEHANFGQYLALKVSKKNYGKPEAIHFLERVQNGVLRPVEPIKDGCSLDLEMIIQNLIIDAIGGRELTVRKLLDEHCVEWKSDYPKISRAKIQKVIESMVNQKKLFEIPSLNASGKKVKYLSITPKDESEPEKGVDDFELDNGKELDKMQFPDLNTSESLNKADPDSFIPE